MSGTIVTGSLVSGLGLGKTFTRLEWARNQFIAKLGIDPYAGTLNVRVNDPGQLAAWQQLAATPGIHIDNPGDGPHDCDARCYPVHILSDHQTAIPAAIVLPEVTGYAANQIELICPVNLRHALGIGDGDQIRIAIA